MASHKIKIEGVADFSSISKEVQDLQKDLQNAFGKDGAKVIDSKSIANLKKDTEQAFVGMTKQLQKLNKEASDLKKAMKSVKDDEKKQEEISRKILENTKKTAQAKSQIRDLTSGNTKINQLQAGGNVIPFPKQTSFSGMAGKTLSSGAGQIANEIPGISPGIQVGSAAIQAGQGAASAGMSTGAIVGIAALGAAAAAGAVAVSRMASGFEAYKSITDKILTLNGMGASAIKAGSRGASMAAEMGFDDSMVLDTQKALNKSFGKAANQGVDENRTINTLTAARGLGLSPGEITSGGNQLRQVGGADSAQKQMAMILEKAFTSGMDKSQSSVYLASAVGLLTELNQSGVTNSSALLATMAGLVSKNNMSPELAAKSLGSLNSAISGSSGENNAFFQSAAGRAGLGGGSILGSQFAVRQGLAGVDMDALNKQIGDTSSGQMGMKAIGEMGLSDPNFSQKFAKSITDEINSRFDTGSKEGRQSALGFTNQMFGGKTAADGARTLALLQKISDSGTKGLGESDKKLLETLTQDPESAWRDKTLQSLDKTALSTEATAAALKNGQLQLGEASSGLFNSLTNALTKLDTTLATFLGGDTFKAMASGMGDFATSMGEIWDGIKELPDMFENMLGKLASSPEELGRALGDGFINSVESLFKGMFGNSEGDGSVSAFVGNGIKSTASDAMSMGGDAFKAVEGFFQKMTGNAPAAGSTNADGSKVDNSDVVHELKKMNANMEKQNRPGGAPRAGRDPTKR